VSQKATQKQITIVKIDNRKQVRKRSNAVATAPPPVLRGVSAIPQPIIPLPPPPDLYETNVLRQRVERLERVREPVREPIRATIETQTETEPVVAPAPVAEPAPVRRRQGFGAGTARRELVRERLISGVEQRIAQGEAREREQMGRFDPITERERLRPVADDPFRRARDLLRTEAESLRATLDEDEEPLIEPTRIIEERPAVPATPRATPARARPEFFPAPIREDEPEEPAPVSAFGDRSIVGIRVNRPTALNQLPLPEYKQLVANMSFTMFNRGYNALGGGRQKAVRDRVLAEQTSSI
jgi:hypothetical protein